MAGLCNELPLPFTADLLISCIIKQQWLNNKSCCCSVQMDNGVRFTVTLLRAISVFACRRGPHRKYWFLQHHARGPTPVTKPNQKSPTGKTSQLCKHGSADETGEAPVPLLALEVWQRHVHRWEGQDRPSLWLRLPQPSRAYKCAVC